MKPNYYLLLILALGLMLTACSPSGQVPPTSVSSPDGHLLVDFFLTESGQPAYTVSYKNERLIDTSTLGFTLKDEAPLMEGFNIETIDLVKEDETWEMPWGEQREVRNQYTEMRIQLKETELAQRQLEIIFRVYDDGLGFRYEFPEQPNLKEVVIMDEHTQFQLTGDHQSWWIPGDWDIYEHVYNTTKVSQINAIAKRDHPNLAQTYIPENAVSTPITMRTEKGMHLSFHEAALTDYAGMTIKVDTTSLMLESELVGWPDGSKVKRTAPFSTPWRTIHVAERAGDLIESNLTVNLNEPNKIGDVSWFKPMKYMGIWWEMHLDKGTWELASGRHSATTENAKRYIDFASENNIEGLLVEGWNTGWEHWIGFEDREGVFDFITPYPDYDIEEVVRYGREKGVELIMHHETSAAPRTYDQQMDTAYNLMNRLGIHSVKTGYVGKIIPNGQRHHGQWMVQHYRRALEKGAARQIAINAHEPIKATGLRRTYPNAISREGLRGQEFNAWASDGGNPPEHLTIVPFTRMLGGPIDFTPGIFNIKLDPYKENNQINTTLAQQLALYVVLYSPIQMAADLPEHYEGQPAFQFIRDVAVDWEQSKVLDGKVGDFVVIARQERAGDRWFLGAVSDEIAREVTVKLDFLEPGRTYTAKLYQDADDAHWDDNPTAIDISEKELTSQDELTLKLAPGGGAAISFE